MKNMKLEKIDVKNINIDTYRRQANVRRRFISGSGFERIIFASDQDLD